MSEKEFQKQKIIQKATELGFDLVGFASIENPELKNNIDRYDVWLEQGHHASMDYLKRHKEKKENPELFLEGVRTVIAVAMTYDTSEKSSDQGPLISKYTRGPDYHKILGDKLIQLKNFILENFPETKSREFVDKDPVLDRFWAQAAGIGWLGKNTCLINRKLGSFIFLGGLMTSLELQESELHPDHCGRCTKCIDACPTQALTEHHLKSELCIGYHTIENKGEVPESLSGKFGGWIAGCDICQNVCPWNEPSTDNRFFPKTNEAYGSDFETLVAWDEKEFKSKMKDIAMGRMKFSMFRRNLKTAIQNTDMNEERRKKLLTTF